MTAWTIKKATGWPGGWMLLYRDTLIAAGDDPWALVPYITRVP